MSYSTADDPRPALRVRLDAEVESVLAAATAGLVSEGAALGFVTGRLQAILLGLVRGKDYEAGAVRAFATMFSMVADQLEGAGDADK